MMKYVAGALLSIAILGFGYWTISPLFRNIKVDEAIPGESPAMMQKEAQSDAVMQKSTSTGEGMMEKTGAEVVGTPAHPASGFVKIIEAEGKSYVRYENFKTINGPDIYVYLSKDKDARDFVNLGRVKATEGNINYEIPADVKVSDYSYVLTWCKTFGVLFNYAQLK